MATETRKLELPVGPGATFHADEHYDPDIFKVHDESGVDAAIVAAQVICECGHPRHQHAAATGALGSFGGSACDLCWTCATFRPMPRIA